MLNLVALLFLITLKQGSQDPSPVKVDLSLDSSKDFTKTYMEFDNASYFVYKGADDSYIDEVTQGHEVVWTFAEDCGKAKAVIMVFENGTPRLLFVYTPGNDYRKFYFVRVDGSWVRTTYYWYSYKLEFLKAKIRQEFSMDIGLLRSTNSFIHYPRTSSKPCDTFLPFKGHAAKGVEHSGTTLWTAKSDDERAVAVWAYKSRSLQYLVSVLVNDGNKNYTFHDFVRISGSWVPMDRTPLELRASHRYPDDIMFPEYLLLKANRQVSTAEERRSADLTDVATSLAINSDYQCQYRPIPQYLCYKLDFSKDSRSLVGRRETSVFEKRLRVVSYLPPPGHYYGILADGSDRIYRRNIDTEASVGVHFYTKARELYLADVLISSPKKPRSEYHVKVDGRWTPVNDRRFVRLLEELRILHRLTPLTHLAG